MSLVDAVKVGDREAARRLIDSSAAVNAQNADGVTALMVAVLNNRAQVAALLLACGADLELRDQKGRTALMLAAEQGDMPDMTAVLLDESFQALRRDIHQELRLLIALVMAVAVAMLGLVAAAAFREGAAHVFA